MTLPDVRPAAKAEEAAAISTIVLAFSSDPMARWCWPNADQYLAAMPALTRAFGGKAFEHGAGYCSNDFAGAALWLPPGIQPDEEAMVALIERTVTPDRRGDLFGVLEQMGPYHPEEPHWYLPLIGVDPAFQGKGYGSALLRIALERCDRDHAVAYLESTNERNIPLYERHGFEAIGTIQVGASPTLVPMVRRAR
jgi:ribosomal protein S18 acetylase RimI-like enzyme